MSKITLPPKVKCWRCEGEGFFVRGSDADPHISIIDNCDCDDGERYVFDDLARAVVAVGIDFNCFKSGYYGSKFIATIYLPRGGKCLAQESGPNPTTALLNAILKLNSE